MQLLKNVQKIRATQHKTTKKMTAWKKNVFINPVDTLIFKEPEDKTSSSETRLHQITTWKISNFKEAVHQFMYLTLKTMIIFRSNPPIFKKKPRNSESENTIQNQVHQLQ